MLQVQPRIFGFNASSEKIISTFQSDSEMKAHPDYASAKAGDVRAAARLVQAVVMPEQIAEAQRSFGSSAVYVPVHAEEAAGRNKIPEALAAYYALATGASFVDTVVQANRAYHTGAGPMERMLARAIFDGEITAGLRYVLVDDVTTMGSTLADLSNHIQVQGGVVVGCALLTDGSRTHKISPLAKTVTELEQRHGQELTNIFGINAAALTYSESQYLLGFKSTDSIRVSVAKARSERSKRLSAKGISERSIDANWTPKLK